MREQREAVTFLVAGGVSMPHACALVQMARSTFRYLAHPRNDTELLTQIRELVARHPRYGGTAVSAFCSDAQRGSTRNVCDDCGGSNGSKCSVYGVGACGVPPARLVATYPRHIWAYDFVEDALADGTPLRILTVIDEFMRQGLAVDVAVTTSAERAIDVLSALIAQHGAPDYLRSNNGAEFVATAIQAWLTQCGVQTLYIDAR